MRTSHLQLILAQCLWFTSEVSNAQVPCSSPIPFTFKTEQVTSNSSNDGKLKIIGDLSPDNRVVASTEPLTIPSIKQFDTSCLFSTLENGYWNTKINNRNQTFYVRIYTPDGSCYTDNKVDFQKIYFTKSTFTDVSIIMNHNGGAFVDIGNEVTITAVVTNIRESDATDLEFTLISPEGLLMLGEPNVSMGEYNPSTKKWSIPKLDANNGLAKLTMHYIVSSSGIRFVEMNLTAQNESETDIDSSPKTTINGEDDQASTCISTPYSLNEGDSYLIQISNIKQQNQIEWRKNGNIILCNQDGSLTVSEIGEYTYSLIDGLNSRVACYKIKVEPGDKSIAKIPPK
jgi:hypothetical protein